MSELGPSSSVGNIGGSDSDGSGDPTGGQGVSQLDDGGGETSVSPAINADQHDVLSNPAGSPDDTRDERSTGGSQNGETEGVPGSVSTVAYSGDGEEMPEPSDPTSEISPERRAAIDRFVETKANATSTTAFGLITYDSDGGEHVGAALNGKSELGNLTKAEERYLADRAVEAWQKTKEPENVREAIAAVRDNPSAREALATALAMPKADQERLAKRGIPSVNTVEGGRFSSYMMRSAMSLDAGATLKAFKGAEDHLGKFATNWSHPEQRALLQAAAQPGVDPVAADRVVTSMFMHTKEGTMMAPATRRAMADALAAIRQPGTTQADAAARQELADKIDGILATSGGRNLLFGEKVHPQLRAWAFEQVATEDGWNAETLRNGWVSDVVSRDYAKPVLERYAARGTEPQTLSGEALRNVVAQGLGLQPDILPSENETPAARKQRLAAGLDHKYYSDNPQLKAVVDRITALGGDEATITVLPVTVTSEEFGAATFPVFKVEGKGEGHEGTTYFVDHQGLKYDSLEAWETENRLPKGRMTYFEGMQLDGKMTDPKNTPQVVDTFWERAGVVGDYAAIGVGVAAGVAIVVGTGGTAALVAAGGAGLYTAGRSGAALHDDHQRGIDITDLSNPAVRSKWLDVAAGTLSLGAIGAGMKVANASKSGLQVSQTLARTTAGLQIAANTADAAAVTNQGIHLAQNWDNLSNGERAAGLLNIAFWGGMTAASTRSTGAPLQDAYSFGRLQNHILYGSPYPVRQTGDLMPGQVRVAYDTGPNGRATNIRIETGGNVDPANLALHSRIARQMEASGGLQDRLANYMSGDRHFEVGSAGWEAKLEIDKIGREAQALTRELNSGNLTAARKAEIEVRLTELETATAREMDRLAHFDQMGEGWVASPKTGAEQAEAKRWEPAPEGYRWVAGPNDTPHLARKNAAESKPLYYDPSTRTFHEVEGNVSKPMERVGHGKNEATWYHDDKGNLTRVRANLSEYYTHAGRSAEELAAQTQIRAQGQPGDHAGHALGHRFVLDQGSQNMFPQDANFNTSAYKTFENEVADWISVGAEVRVDMTFSNRSNGRPTNMAVRYEVVDPSTGNVVHKDVLRFGNDANQTYGRVERGDIEVRWDGRAGLSPTSPRLGAGQESLTPLGLPNGANGDGQGIVRGN